MKKRIAFISEHASPLVTPGSVDAGGQNVYVGELAKQLSRMGYAVDVFTRRENPDLPAVTMWMEEVRVIQIDAGPAKVVAKEELLPYMAAFREEMISFMEEEQTAYHLVHANFFMSALVAMELKQLLGIPFVVTFHALGHVRKIYQGDKDRFPPERTDIETEVILQANQIIAECPQDKEDLINYYKAPVHKITIIPCGVNLDEVYAVDKEKAREILKLPKNEKIILQLGRMVPRKGVDNVIRAMAQLKMPDVKLIIVGSNVPASSGDVDYELERLRTLANELKVGAQVIFAGQRSRHELKHYYSAADLFITTPWYEPFGITPLESMACGTPVIGSDVGGIKYSVADGRTGLLVPPEDPVSLAAAIFKLLQDDSLRQEMGSNAIKRIHALFTWECVARKMKYLYQQVINEAYYEKSHIY
ncbi:glycosyltransferase family 4 protein [Chitinophaga silvisoli]|uniref:Glycosyltransferase family 1 protein n=1 Tax=Chitinophaga silvisoli TaxID=2291814 RepID=A0A3E1P9D2_9BACT|nr:glycosyltransferase family 1 protein [Chitinophaga silvisoli]RFM36747.1 glycosyltransferase family 1 protein [Chitinophaga silvisoli]